MANNMNYSFMPAFYSDKAPSVKLIGYSDVMNDVNNRPESVLTEDE